MRVFALMLISALTLASSSAFAASYLDRFGTTVAPIQYVGGGDHAYGGGDLMPGANLDGAVLADANLTDSLLTNAILTNANLSRAYLRSAVLTKANLANANLIGVDFSDAVLTNATGLGSASGDSTTLYNANTIFTGTGFDPVAAGWAFVPEPGPALLMGFGLAGLAGVRPR